ncbi:rhodanese-like domain-containing protein [uncultured Bilophila sp.]|uniref:rhodanese-like domain-containing protein n=1 Tax=uncultured Bilophila sp. TaxID=529385 RepID=UPI003436DE4E
MYVRRVRRGHVPGALHIPMADLERRMGDVPGGRILVLCRSGKRAERAWNLLHAARPRQEIWFLTGKPCYGTNGSWRFAD